MQRFCVESRRDEAQGAIPVRVGFTGALQDVVEILDQWAGRDHRYYRLRTRDDARFLVRWDETQSSWSLVFFQAGPEAAAPPRDGSV